ncbi:sensor histidine kinase, partial [Actinoplanes philippinensis]|uniref:sensor histidine kinase n=1 Tax=Actinoplanes philippinensis TaxID=35752 RepID=UPI0034045775
VIAWPVTATEADSVWLGSLGWATWITAITAPRTVALARRRRPLAWVIGCGLVSCAFQIHHHGQGTGQNSHDMLSLLAHPLVVVPLAAAYGRARPDRVQARAVVRRTVLYGTVSSLVLFVHSAGARIYEGVWQPAPFAVALTVTVVLVAAWDHLQHAANYIAYGIRRDPLRTLADLRAGVASGADSDLLPTAVRTVAAAVRAGGATLVLPDGTVSVRAGDEPDDRYLTLPLRYGGTTVGELRVACRRRESRYSRIEVQLLEALAAQVAVLVKATELGEALEAERARVIAATRDERDRLRRDLHDGLGPSLAGMGLGLQALSSLVGDGTPEARMVRRLRDETDIAVRDIRRIIDALRPTVLDAENLVGAVERHAVALRSALAVELTAGTLPALGSDVEVAAYRIVTEALTNAARHARAERAWITITADDALHISVSDDGLGIRHEGPHHGVGLASMRRRAEVLGGGLAVHSTMSGTTVTATLPLRNP